MPDHAIIIEGLEKYYGSFKALHGVNLKVRQGEILGFLGPNGAGKTTTIRCILDQIRPQKGTIHIFGVNPQANPVAVHKMTGYLPGELRLEDNFRVEEQLRYFSHLRSNHFEWTYVEELAERLILDLSRVIKNLSSGNKQKVGIIQALMHKPELLLLDEPTSGLDPLMQQEVYRLLREAQAGGATVFFSSHIISEVETLAERVAIIRAGVIVEEAEPHVLTQMAIRRVKIRFLEHIDPVLFQSIEGVKLISSRNGMELILEVEGDLDRLIKILAGVQVKDMETTSHSLEEIFLKYYQSEGEERV
ncbi:MAG: ABC transporter ATP-binding protein [Anaerolineales bacterium]|nr:MAG: ABC transporter ATP-binding protein [Anaerolineales bacterium]